MSGSLWAGEGHRVNCHISGFSFFFNLVYGEVSGAQVEYQQKESNRCDYLIVHGPMVACSTGMA